MPQISSMSLGPAPVPVQAEPATGFEDVTKG
jgi:hypothetical protein